MPKSVTILKVASIIAMLGAVGYETGNAQGPAPSAMRPRSAATAKAERGFWY